MLLSIRASMIARSLALSRALSLSRSLSLALSLCDHRATSPLGFLVGFLVDYLVDFPPNYLSNGSCSRHAEHDESKGALDAWQAAARGNVGALRQLRDQGVDLSSADYDRRYGVDLQLSNTSLLLRLRITHTSTITNTICSCLYHLALFCC
jgi:hypothetical protein